MPEYYEIEFPTSVYENPNDIHNLIQLTNIPDSDQPIRLNIPDSGYATPIALTILAASISRWKDANRKVRIRGTVRSAIVRYMQRIDFFNVLKVKIDESFARHDPDSDFSPMQCIEPATDTENIAMELSRVVSKPDPNILKTTNYCIGELLANCQQHSENIGFTCSQYYRSTGQLRISISDIGIGIRRSFSSSQYSTRTHSDVRAVNLALQKNITSKSPIRMGAYDYQANTGNGLYFIRRIAEETNGRMIVISGNVMTLVQPGSICNYRSAGWNGTSVNLAFNRDICDWKLLQAKIYKEITTDRRLSL